MMKHQTLGELRGGKYGLPRANRTVKEEMRENLIELLQRDEELFPGIVGYNDSVVPQIVNAVLSRHNFILLGLRGQAKSRILRALTRFLDPQMPVIRGCEIHDNPFQPICQRCRHLIAEMGDATPITFLTPEERYIEKLATPDVTMADLIGDIDPIRAAKGGYDLSNELSIHYGLLPRANRGIFAINELPDLAGKVQVGLFNIMQEGDIQIKGYPVRMTLDIALLFSANPEDYTARGKIVTPLKDRIGSEIRTHYPVTAAQGMEITSREAWINRSGLPMYLLPFVSEVVEQIAFIAREDKRVDKRSGISQRLPISCMENVISNAERRALRDHEQVVVPRACDIYSALPAITGKLELEYEGEMRGADAVSRELIRLAIGKVFNSYFEGISLQQIVQWFELGGEIRLGESTATPESLQAVTKIQGLMEKVGALGVEPKDRTELHIAAAEFILEGLHAHKRIGRTEEEMFKATEPPANHGEKTFEDEHPGRRRRTFN